MRWSRAGANDVMALRSCVRSERCEDRASAEFEIVQADDEADERLAERYAKGGPAERGLARKGATPALRGAG